jgi:DNA polymerase
MSRPIVSLDIETRSRINLKKSGMYRYFEDDSTDCLCLAFKIDGEEVQGWSRGNEVPDDYRHALSEGAQVYAWNAPFERQGNLTVLNHYGFPQIATDRFSCTAAMAASMNLPRSLDQASKALATSVLKDEEGYKLMMRMCKPQKHRSGPDKGMEYWIEDEESLERLLEYCKVDVEAESSVRHRLVDLCPGERAVFAMDQTMNDRGVMIDATLVGHLQTISSAAKVRLNAELEEVTEGALTALSQVKRLSEWFEDQGLKMDSLDKNAISEALHRVSVGPLANRWDIKRVLELRQDFAKASTAKLDAMQNCMQSDGRARGLHLYHGASTGRWAGRLIQPQNMPRGGNVIKFPSKVAHLFGQCSSDIEMVDMLIGEPMAAVSDMLRSCMTASPGNRLVVADYSSIEGRVTAWLARDLNELEGYRLADLKMGPEMYVLVASKIFNIDPKQVTPEQRQVGKVACLALGYQGGVGAFDAMAKTYQLDMAMAYEPLMQTSTDEDIEAAEKFFQTCYDEDRTLAREISREAWLASELTKRKWRNAHPEIVDMWSALENAVIKAVENPGSIVPCLGIQFKVTGGYLWAMLPSTRCLAYADPTLISKMTPWGKATKAVSAMCVDSKTKKWVRRDLYGGLLTENMVQAIARDLMAHGMICAEEAGYPIVMTIHDEAVADVPEGIGSLEVYEKELCKLEPWAAGIPLIAEGYEDFRYRKG